MSMTKFKTIGNAKKITGLSYLGNIGTSSKIIKNSKKLNIDTYILYLAPWKQSGYQVCAGATPECIAGCLNTSGRAGMEINSNNENRIVNSRIRKTKMLFENREFFLSWLFMEISTAKKRSEKKGNEFSVRLNGTSDINWKAMKLKGKTLFDLFPTVQFYDYTKIPNRFNNIPANYHLTFSYTGRNWSDCEILLNKGYNVAVVFDIVKWYNQKKENVQPLPIKYKNFNVVDGDITDYRPYDSKGVIVGLRWKRIANKANEKYVKESMFVIQPNDINCEYNVPALV